MTAFFHLDPVLVTSDVQQYWDPSRTLSQSYRLSPPGQDETVPGSAVKLPSLDVASWAWLQPFFVSSSDVSLPSSSSESSRSSRPSKSGGEEEEASSGAGSGGSVVSGRSGVEGGGQTKYMALGLAKVDAKPGFEKGPYTALEGYLQLKAPIIRPGAPVVPSGGGNGGSGL